MYTGRSTLLDEIGTTKPALSAKQQEPALFSAGKTEIRGATRRTPGAEGGM